MKLIFFLLIFFTGLIKGQEITQRKMEEASVEVKKEEKEDNKKSYFSPKTGRNPFISFEEYQYLKLKEEEAKKIMDYQTKKIGFNPAERYKLNGIVGKYAIINGVTVKEGGMYKKEFKLEKVFSNYVIIDYNGKKYKLIMK